MAELYLYDAPEPGAVLFSFTKLDGPALVPAKANDLNQAPPDGFTLPPDFRERTVAAHLPVAELRGRTVHIQVGKDLHMMEPEHYIQWIMLQTTQGGCWKNLAPGDKPAAFFELRPGEEARVAYAFCNLHGVWREEVDIWEK